MPRRSSTPAGGRSSSATRARPRGRTPRRWRTTGATGARACTWRGVFASRELFEEATRIDAGFGPAWLNLGALALRYRDYAAAEQAYGRAIQIDGARWESRLARGWALEGLGKPREARAEYEKVLAVEPRQDDALFGKAVALRAE